MQVGTFEDYIYISKFYFSLTGVWPVPENVSACRNFINKFHAMCVVILLLIFFLLPMILDLNMVSDDFNAIFQNLPTTVHSTFFTLKFVHIASNKKTFKKVLRILQNNVDNILSASVSEEKKSIIRKYGNFALFVTKIFAFCLYSLQTLICLQPMIYGKDSDPARYRRYPCTACFYFDQSSNAAYFIFYGIQSFMLIFLATSIIIGVDTFIFLSVWNLCAQLRILQSELLNVGHGSEESSNALQKIVQSHTKQISNIHVLHQFISKICLYQLSTSACVICLIGLQLMTALSNGKSSFAEAAKFLFFFVGSLLQILLYCWPINELMLQSLEIGNAAYHSLWTNLSPRSSKAIILIILRAQNPDIITARGMYKVTLECFTSILKMSLSFLSVLRVMLSTQN